MQNTAMKIQVCANDDSFSSRRARSVPVLSSMSTIRGYPAKLKIFRISGSRFWQMRCYIGGRMYVRSTRTVEKLLAIDAAKSFYDELVLNERRASQQESIFFYTHKANEYSVSTDADRNNQKRSVERITFQSVAVRAIEAEHSRMLRGELAMQSFRALSNRLRKQIFPDFGEIDIREVSFGNLQQFLDKLVQRQASSVTIAQYFQAIRLVLRYALIEGLIKHLPPFPKLRLKSQPRGGFTVLEYKALLRAAKFLAGLQDLPKATTHRDRAGGIYTKTASVPAEMAWMIGFMVNSFLRPSDLKYIQHKHIEVVRTSHLYLRLTIPETKRHRAQIVTLRPAVRIYQSLCKYQRLHGLAGPDNYLFMPHIEDRDAAVVIMSANFNKVLVATNLKIGELGQARSLYSLRHTAIMFRLLYGKGIDLLTLARNARTSVKMIEDFYASNLTAEMNIALLQSKRHKGGRQGELVLGI